MVVSAKKNIEVQNEKCFERNHTDPRTQMMVPTRDRIKDNRANGKPIKKPNGLHSIMIDDSILFFYHLNLIEAKSRLDYVDEPELYLS